VREDTVADDPSATGVSRQTADCPDCGAAVPVLAGRRLAAHREGSAAYAYPRCLGSLRPVPRRRDR